MAALTAIYVAIFTLNRAKEIVKDSRERDKTALEFKNACLVKANAEAIYGTDTVGLYPFEVPGIEMSTGSLGQGFSASCGMALAAKLDGSPSRIYTLLGDGEIQEGMIWEAAMSASNYELDNLTAILDWNGLQIDGRNEDVMKIAPIADKFAGFGWNVIEIDGHDFGQILDACDKAKACKGKPTVIIAKTVKGKGVSFMEDQASWHGSAPDDAQCAQAVEELGGEW